jgi:hypothetical protein
MLRKGLYLANGQRVSVLLALAISLVSVGCLAAQKQPDWTMSGLHGDFPDSHYISGVGQGDSRDKAADRARAEISKRFRVSVDSSSVSSQSLLLTNLNGVETDYSKENLRELTSTSTKMVIEDVRIAETWFDKKTVQYFALAVLDRRKAFTRVEKKTSDVLAEVSRMVDEAAASESPIKRIGRLVVASKLFNQCEPLISQAVVLNPSWSPDSGCVSSEALNRLFSEAASQFPVHISVTPTGTPVSKRMYQAVQDSLTKVGIPVVAYADDSVVQVAVVLTIRDTGMTPSGFAFSTADAAISVRAIGNDDVISSKTISEREGGNTIVDARAKAENRIVDKVSREFFSFIYDSLMK